MQRSLLVVLALACGGNESAPPATEPAPEGAALPGPWSPPALESDVRAALLSCPDFQPDGTYGYTDAARTCRGAWALVGSSLSVEGECDEGGKKPLAWTFQIARIWRHDGLPVVLGRGPDGWGAFGCVSEEGENVRVPMAIQWVEVADGGGGRDAVVRAGTAVHEAAPWDVGTIDAGQAAPITGVEVRVAPGSEKLGEDVRGWVATAFPSAATRPWPEAPAPVTVVLGN